MKQLHSILIVSLLAAGCAAQKTIPLTSIQLIRWICTRDIPDEFYRAHGKELLRILSQEMYALCTNELPDSGLVFEYIVEDLPHIHRGHFAFTTERLDSTIDEALRTLTVQRCAACIDRLVQAYTP